MKLYYILHVLIKTSIIRRCLYKTQVWMLYQVFENVTRPVRADERERESCLWNIESEKSCLWNLKSRSSRGIFCFFFISSRGNFGTYKQRFLGTTSQFSWFLMMRGWFFFWVKRKKSLTLPEEDKIRSTRQIRKFKL